MAAKTYDVSILLSWETSSCSTNCLHTSESTNQNIPGTLPSLLFEGKGETCLRYLVDGVYDCGERRFQTRMSPMSDKIKLTFELGFRATRGVLESSRHEEEGAQLTREPSLGECTRLHLWRLPFMSFQPTLLRHTVS